MKKTIRILMALMCIASMLFGGMALAEAPTETPEPVATPSPEELGELTFRILDEEGNEVTTIQYSEFENGKYALDGLTPGTYTVTEVDPDQLLENYTFDEENSVQSITVEVKAKETASDTLVNVYEREVEVSPTPTPEATATPTVTPEPEDSPTPEPVLDERITIPVTKVWDDQGNRDGNRPDRVMVNLMANGSKTAQAVLSAATGWSCEFTDLPKYSNGAEITYTVTEDPVSMYTANVDGFVITNVYTPVTTTATVSKVWVDNDNAAGLRPGSIYCTLSNGMHVTLNEENGWTATVENLPAIVNGQPATYSWTEQEVIGYSQTAVDVSGNNAQFTNTIIERPTEAPEGKTTPTNKRGDSYLIIDDYGTPLGVDVVINHVGDCFD